MKNIMRSSIAYVRTGTQVAVTVLMMLVHGIAPGATPPAWKSTLYMLPEGDTTLEQVFTDFRRLLNTPVDIADTVKGPTASLGQPATVEGFLDSLALRHGLTWFVFRGRLYVSRQSDVSEVRIKVLASRMAEVRSYLVGIKLLDERFTWAELASRDEVMVQGPPAYVDLVSLHAASVKPSIPSGPPPPPPPEPQEIMTFRLQYASAADDGTGRLGIASLLTRLYGGSGFTGPVPASLRGVNFPRRALERGAAAHSSASGAAGAARPAMGRDSADSRDRPDPADSAGWPDLQKHSSREFEELPSFEADPRLNMVIVRDKPSRRAVYERVIAALDINTEQIALDATVIELPVNAMRDALATISANAALATSASGMPALVVPRNVVERAFEQVSRARQKEGGAAIMTQGLVFSEDDPFSLDFADRKTLPQYSTTIWETLAASLIPMKITAADTERSMGIKLAGSAKYIVGRGINVKLELSEDRSQPEKKTKSTLSRSTSAAMSVELREDQVLVLVNSSVWSGDDVNEPRARAVLLSAQRWQTKSPPATVQPAARSPPLSQTSPRSETQTEGMRR